MTVVFRTVVVPLKAMVGFLLSVLMALGATVAVFQWGWLASLIGVSQTSPVLSLLPLLLTGILFGLSMDYEVFLVSRMREEHVHVRPAREAVVHGFQYGARVVTAAAAIMIGMFGGFALGDDAIVKSIGFGLAFGILSDAFLVRMTLVPAFMALLGERMWWLPRWLDGRSRTSTSRARRSPSTPRTWAPGTAGRWRRSSASRGLLTAERSGG